MHYARRRRCRACPAGPTAGREAYRLTAPCRPPCQPGPRSAEGVGRKAARAGGHRHLRGGERAQQRRPHVRPRLRQVHAARRLGRPDVVKVGVLQRCARCDAAGGAVVQHLAEQVESQRVEAGDDAGQVAGAPLGENLL